jgi:carbon-monoxide dehydrogenase small subunit
VPKLHVQTTLNGDSVDFLCDPADTLLDVLRNRLNLTGTKEGCSTGDCGACSVLVNDRLVPSCLVLAAEVDDQRLLTVEGVATGDALHPIQQKLLEHAALQCGICTPGIVVAAKALLDKNPNPTEKEVRFWLAGNLCRCTGYDKIIRAVLDAAAVMRDGATATAGAH